MGVFGLVMVCIAAHFLRSNGSRRKGVSESDSSDQESFLPNWAMFTTPVGFYDYPTQYIGDYNNPIGGSLLTNQYNGITGFLNTAQLKEAWAFGELAFEPRMILGAVVPDIRHCSEAFIILPQIDGTTMDEQTHTQELIQYQFISLWYYLGMDIFYQKMQGWSGLPRVSLSSPAFTVCEMPGSEALPQGICQVRQPEGLTKRISMYRVISTWTRWSSYSRDTKILHDVIA